MRLIKCLVYIFVFSLVTSQTLAQQLITSSQAMAAVREFEGNQSLDFSDVELDMDTEGPVWSHSWWYDLKINSYPNPDRTWTVNAVTGEVTGVFYGNNYPTEPTEIPFGALTQENCRQIAESFAIAKYDEFGAMNMQLVVSEWICTGWRFEWRETVAYGALSVNGVDVEINPTNGIVQSYRAVRCSQVNPNQPQLSSSQALQIAKNAAGIVVLDWVQDQRLYAYPNGEVYWSVLLGGTTAQDKYVIFSVCLDAVSGAIIEKSPARTRQGTLTDLDTQARQSIWVREGVSKLPKVSVHWLGKQGARIFAGATIYDLKPSSDTVICGDKQIKLHGKTELVKGRLMVPMELFLIISRRQ